jgi:hypothetical protein
MPSQRQAEIQREYRKRKRARAVQRHTQESDASQGTIRIISTPRIRTPPTTAPTSLPARPDRSTNRASLSCRHYREQPTTSRYLSSSDDELPPRPTRRPRYQHSTRSQSQEHSIHTASSVGSATRDLVVGLHVTDAVSPATEAGPDFELGWEGGDDAYPTTDQFFSANDAPNHSSDATTGASSGDESDATPTPDWRPSLPSPLQAGHTPTSTPAQAHVGNADVNHVDIFPQHASQELPSISQVLKTVMMPHCSCREFPHLKLRPIWPNISTTPAHSHINTSLPYSAPFEPHSSP